MDLTGNFLLSCHLCKITQVIGPELFCAGLGDLLNGTEILTPATVKGQSLAVKVPMRIFHNVIQLKKVDQDAETKPLRPEALFFARKDLQYGNVLNRSSQQHGFQIQRMGRQLH